MPTIEHFEIPADDVDRAQEFYAQLFGWEFAKMEGPIDYRIAKTGDGKKEGPCCGLMARQHPQHLPTNYVTVASVDEYATKTVKLGGKVVVGKTAVPKHGWFVVCLDSENNCLGLWQTDENAG